MFTSYTPNECKVEKRNVPLKIKLSRGSIPSELCKLPYPPSHPRIFDEICPKDVTLRCVESALSIFNEQSPSKQGPKYELVDALKCINNSKIGVYHCNFIARLQNESEAQDKLFFAELVYNEGPVMSCPLCCILGPRGTETGQYGCKSCRRHPGLIQHPNDRFSRSMLFCKADHRSGLWNLGSIFLKENNFQPLEEIKFPQPESASTSCKNPRPDYANCCYNKLPYPPLPPSFGGRCREDTILKNSKSALSSSYEQSTSKQGPRRAGMFGYSDDFCSHPGSFHGKCNEYLAEIALSSFNEQSLSKQGPEYVLVDVLNYITLRMQGIFHCNFIARLKNEGEAEDKLFFAELKFCGGPDPPCLLCCILGPRGTVTGEYGCKSCLRRPGFVHHPEDGFLRTFEYGDVHGADAGLSMVSREAGHLSGLWSSGMVNKSRSPEEINFRLPESALTPSKNPRPDYGNCFYNNLKNAKSALSSSYEQSTSKQGPRRAGMFGYSDDFCSHPGSFHGKCNEYLAEIALSSFNEQSLSKQGPEYVLVDVLNYITLRMQGIFHCNFIARLKNEGEAEDKLFFAELKFCGGPDPPCLLCCILGPRGTVTGEYGCMSCLRRPGLVQHPEDGFLKTLTVDSRG